MCTQLTCHEMEGMRRRRFPVTLYSEQGQSSEGTPQEDEFPPENTSETTLPEEGHSNRAQIIHVAQSMFTSMCDGLESEVITKENIDNAIQNLVISEIDPTKSLLQTSVFARSSKGMKESIRKLLKEAMQRSSTNEVTSELFCQCALRYSEGDISLLDMLDDGGEVPDPAIKKQDFASLGALLDYPRYTMKVLRKSVLRTVERRGIKWLWSTFSTKQLYWLMAAYFLPMMTVQFIVSSVSTAVFTGAVLAMLLITIQIALNSEKYQIRMDYLSLFQCFNKSEVQIDIKKPKSDLFYYGHFLVALLVALGTVGFSNRDFIHSELLVVVSMFVSFLIVLQFDLYESHLVYLLVAAKGPSWLVVVLEKVCVLFAFSLPRTLLYVREPLWSLPLYYGFEFSISIISIIQVAGHLYLLLTQLRNVRWESFLSFHGPHFLFLCWFVLCRQFVSSSSPFVLAKITIAIALIPAYSIVFLFIPFYFVYQYGLFTFPFFYSLLFLVVALLFSLVIMYFFRKRKSLWMSLSLDYVLLLILVLLIPLVLYLSAWYASMYQPPSLPLVSTDQYAEYCGSGNWDSGNMIQTQINCFHLEGRTFHSRGKVESVAISQAVNGMSDSIKFLPSSLQAAITCYIGELDPMCGGRKDMSTCVNNGCHLMRHTRYTFEMKLKVPINGGTENLKAKMFVPERYKDFLMKLRSGSRIEFRAMFVGGMGSDQLTLKAVYLSDGTEDTQDIEEEKEKEMMQSMFHKLVRSVRNIVFVLLEVLVGYTP